MEANTGTIVIGVIVAISEGVALIPGMKSNSIFQLIYFVIKAVVCGIKDKEV